MTLWVTVGLGFLGMSVGVGSQVGPAMTTDTARLLVAIPCGIAFVSGMYLVAAAILGLPLLGVDPDVRSGQGHTRGTGPAEPLDGGGASLEQEEREKKKLASLFGGKKKPTKVSDRGANT